MTMRLSLLIQGDAAGAKQALDETANAVENLGRKSEETGRKLESASKGIEWETPEDHAKRMEEWGVATGKTRDELRGLGEDSVTAQGGAKAVTEAAREVVPELQTLGSSADTARGHFSSLSSVLLGVAGGVAGAIAITAVGEGLKIATGFASELYREITSNAPLIERTLEAHAGLVGRIKGAWAEAQGAASSYGVDSIAQLRFESQRNVHRLEDATRASQFDLDRDSEALRTSDVLGNPFGKFGPFKEVVAEFRQELREGNADIIEFRRNIAEIAEDLPRDSPFAGMAEQIFADTKAAAELQAELARSRDMLEALKGDAEAAATALGGKAEKYQELSDSAGAATATLSEGANEIARTGEAAAAAIPQLTEYDRLMQSIGGAGAGGVSAGGSQTPQFMTTRQAVTTPLIGGAGFAAGGWTGPGPIDQIAGFVHGNEYVMDAETTARIGVGNLDAIRAGVRGYAGGGFVGAAAQMAGPTGGGGGGSVTNAIFGAAEALRSLQGAVVQFGSTLYRTSDAGQALASIIQSVSQRFLDFSLRALDQAIFGGGRGGSDGFGLLGNLFGIAGGMAPNAFPPAPMTISGGLYHSGGRVGGSPAMSRMVSPSVFIDAPRSSDLQPGERPIIAQDGEEIGWPDQLARKYGGGGTTINNFHVETPNPKAFAESRSTVARAAGRLAARSGRHN